MAPFSKIGGVVWSECVSAGGSDRLRLDDAVARRGTGASLMEIPRREQGLGLLARMLGARDRRRPAAARGLARIERQVAPDLALAAERYTRDPNWNTAVASANALRRAKRFDEALAMFQKATEHDPEDLTANLDIGDMLIDAERYAEALASYERTLAEDPEHPWALPSAQFCRFMTGDADYLLQISVADSEDYERIYRTYLTRLPGVARIRSSFALRVVSKKQVTF